MARTGSEQNAGLMRSAMLSGHIIRKIFWRGTPHSVSPRRVRRGQLARAGGWPLSWHLVALCAAVLAPMIVLEGVLLFSLGNGERTRREGEARDAARRITVSLDRELTAMGTLMEVLATSDYLRAGNVDAFISRARDVPRLPGADIILRDAGGRWLAGTGRAEADPEAPGAAATVGPEGPATSFSGFLTRPRAAFSVSVGASGPNGPGSYRISLEVPLAQLGEHLHTAEIPSGMTASLTDRSGHILARTQDAARLVGTQVSLPLRVSADEQQGWRRGRNITGEDVVMAFSRSVVSGWTVAVFMPHEAFTAPLRRSFWAGLGLAGLLALLVAAMASLFARRIAQPITSLAGLAAGRKPSAIKPSEGAVREVNAVRRALEDARAESATRLHESEDLLLTLDQAQVLVREPGGRVLVWTSGTERLYGWTREEALGRVSHKLLQTVFPKPVEEIMAELLERGEWKGELRQRRRDGRTVTVISQWALRHQADGQPGVIVEASNDVSELREAEAALRLSRDLLASVLNASTEPISARDMAGRFVVLNQPAAALLGTTVEAAIGRAPDEFLSSGIDEAMQVDRKVIASGEPQVLESEFPTPDGGLRVLLSSKGPWRDVAGHMLGVVTVSRDITVRRDALVRLQQLQDELLHVSRLSAMGALAAELAHELNQPLTAVANFADAARRLLTTDGAPGPAQLGAARQAMADAAAQAVHAGRVVRRLRNFIGRGESDRRLVSLNEVVEEAVSLAMTGAGKQGVALRLELDQRAPEILAERVQVQQVVFNLARNAVEAMQEAGRRELRVTTEAGGVGSVMLGIADTGSGIEPALAAYLFEPFRSTKAEGMGIGLSICRRIVEEHGGRIWAEETPGGGTTFRVSFPVALREPATQKDSRDES